MSPHPSPRLIDFGQGLLTLVTGLVGGAIFLLLAIPLPWVLGSLTATALIARTSWRQRLPASWRSFAMVIIGTMLGASFSADVALQAVTWLPSLVVMWALTILFWIASFWVLRRWSDMDKSTALLASVPGGLSVVTAIADDYEADTRRIALSHTARLIILLVLTPIMLGFLSDYDLAAAARQSLVFTEALDPLQLLLLTLCGALGFWIAKIVRLPSGMLILPMLLSAIAHATGLITIHVPGPISIVAQLIIGASAGVRFFGYATKDILRDGWIAAIIGATLSIVSMLTAVIVASAMGFAVAPLLLSYLPGGAPELGVVSLAIQADPAMVAVHHVTRVFLIMLLIPVALNWALGRGRQQ